MAFHIKICGLKTPEMVAHATASGADMVGLVFFDKSPRNVTREKARAAAEAAPAGTSIVGLFVNPQEEQLTEVLAAVPLTHIQLHGQETPTRVADIAKTHKLPVLKALGIASAQDVAAAEEHTSADMLLFDAKPPEDAAHPGGLGQVFDWSLLSGVSGQKPWLLSGGLTPENVYDAITAVQHLPGFAGVDVSSGVECLKGEKDARLIETFVSAAHAAMSEQNMKDA
jgi:phosphoribosylanthranilate isomerase